VTRTLWSKTELLIRNAHQIRILRPGSPLKMTDSLSNPIRVADSPKYQFLEVEVLPIKCGEYLGTLEVLNALKQKGFWNFDTIRPLVVDYDLWWRIQRMILSSSTIGCFSTLRKKTLLIQGPWHLYKVLSEAFWKAFDPLCVYRVFLRTSCKNSPVASKTLELKQITETMIALWSWRRDHLLFEGLCHLARIKLALNELVPLVGSTAPSDSLFRFLYFCSDPFYRTQHSGQQLRGVLPIATESLDMASCAWKNQLFQQLLSHTAALQLLVGEQSPSSRGSHPRFQSIQRRER
jgi:hypothetical protein